MRQTTAVLIFGPIGIALVWLVFGYIYAALMQGGLISARTRRWLFNVRAPMRRPSSAMTPATWQRLGAVFEPRADQAD